MKRPSQVVVVVAAILVLAACSSTGSVDGPVLTSPRPPLLGGGGMGAIVEGTVQYDGDCLHLTNGDFVYPVVWPHGTRWRDDPPSVVLDSQVVEPGTDVTGGGGWLSVAHIDEMAGQEVATAAERCIGSTGEVAFFNIGSEVEVASG